MYRKVFDYQLNVILLIKQQFTFGRKNPWNG